MARLPPRNSAARLHKGERANLPAQLRLAQINPKDVR
jgi:hypothetical protein